MDEIPWSKWTHAYGSADDVPALLEAVHQGDEDALYELYGNIWHQGTVYEATPHAVPYLLAALSSPHADLSKVLSLLHALGTGESAKWADTSTAAVSEGVETYLALLQHKDAAVRASAAHTLSACRLRAESVLPHLLAHVQRETEPLVRAEAVTSLGALAEDANVLRGLLFDPEPIVRVACALALSRRPGALSPEAVHVLRTDVPRVIDALGDLESMALESDPISHLLASVFAQGERTPLTLELLDGWLQHPDSAIRRDLAMAAEDIAPELAGPSEGSEEGLARLKLLLAKVLEDPDAGVRKWALRAIDACDD